MSKAERGDERDKDGRWRRSGRGWRRSSRRSSAARGRRRRATDDARAQRAADGGQVETPARWRQGRRLQRAIRTDAVARVDGNHGHDSCGRGRTVCWRKRPKGPAKTLQRHRAGLILADAERCARRGVCVVAALALVVEEERRAMRREADVASSYGPRRRARGERTRARGTRSAAAWEELAEGDRPGDADFAERRWSAGARTGDAGPCWRANARRRTRQRIPRT